MADIKRTIPGFERTANTLRRVVKDAPERRLELEVGDATRPDFVPQFKNKWFDNEYNVSVRAAEHLDAVVTTRGNKIRYETPGYTVIQYEKPEAGDEGGFEFEWELPSKPDSNILPFTLRYKGDVRFYHQPALTQKEIAEGAHRPENVVDSYAVYVDKKNHRKGGNNYASGKIQHIYRPKAIDANGNEAWCKLHIPETGEAETNIDCSVEVPQDFLDAAVFPILVDPTFGYTTIGASQSSIGQEASDRSRRRGVEVSPGTTGTIDSFSAALSMSDSNDTVDTRVALNEKDSVTTNEHGELASVIDLNTSITTTPGWFTYTANDESFPDSTLILTINADGSDIAGSGDRANVQFDNGDSNNIYQWTLTGATAFADTNADPYEASPSPTVASLFSIYATYTAGPTYTLTADAGSFTLSGTAASLTASRLLTADAGSFTLTGQDASLLASRTLTADPGSFTLTGQDATFSRSYVLDAEAGSFTLTGQDATLTYSGVGCNLLQETGDALLQENDDNILLESCSDGPSGPTYTLTADPGSFTLTGQDANLLVGRVLTADLGSFTLSGQDATFSRSYVLTAESGSFTLTGQDVTLTYSGVAGNIKYYNGSSWVVKQLKRYNGSTWENVDIKRYNGSSYDTLTY